MPSPHDTEHWNKRNNTSSEGTNSPTCSIKIEWKSFFHLSPGPYRPLWARFQIALCWGQWSTSDVTTEVLIAAFDEALFEPWTTTYRTLWSEATTKFIAIYNTRLKVAICTFAYFAPLSRYPVRTWSGIASLSCGRFVFLATPRTSLTTYWSASDVSLSYSLATRNWALQCKIQWNLLFSNIANNSIFELPSWTAHKLLFYAFTSPQSSTVHQGHSSRLQGIVVCGLMLVSQLWSWSLHSTERCLTPEPQVTEHYKVTQKWRNYYKKLRD